MKNRFPIPFRFQPTAGGLMLGLVFLLGASAGAQELLKNGTFESPLPVADPTAGWAVVFPGGYDGDYADWAIASRTLAASRVGGGHGAHLRPNNSGYVHAYFKQVVTNLTPGAVYTLNIQKMKSGFTYTEDSPPKMKVYAAMISGSSSNAVHGYSTNNGPYSLVITCSASGQIEVQLHNLKLSMTNESADDAKHMKCSAWFDDFSLTLTP